MLELKVLLLMLSRNVVPVVLCSKRWKRVQGQKKRWGGGGGGVPLKQP